MCVVAQAVIHAITKHVGGLLDHHGGSADIKAEGKGRGVRQHPALDYYTQDTALRVLSMYSIDYVLLAVDSPKNSSNSKRNKRSRDFNHITNKMVYV